MFNEWMSELGVYLKDRCIVNHHHWNLRKHIYLRIYQTVDEWSFDSPLHTIHSMIMGGFGSKGLIIFRLQEMLKQKRLEREEQEKKEQIAREKQRRTQGKEIVSVKSK